MTFYDKKSLAQATKPECKKFKKIKYEIDLQNFKINQLKKDLEAKICKNFPCHVIEELNNEIQAETCRLEKMIKLAMGEQSKAKEDTTCVWGSISTNDKLFTKPPKTPSDVSNVTGVTEALMSENEALVQTQCALQQDILDKDDSICKLHQKIASYQKELSNLTKANQEMACKLADSCADNDENKKLQEQLAHFTKLAESMTDVICKAEKQLKDVRCEFDCLKRDKEMLEAYDKPKCPPECPGNDPQAEKLEYLKEQYEHLLQQYCKKDKEYKETTKRLQRCLTNNDNDTARVENEALRKESEKLIAEIEDYRVLIKELQSQIDVYRDKFMKAQEKVETQKLKINKLESSKNSIEKQVNEEIERIKEKFQEKLNELCPYPEKYAESRKELENARARVSVLESHLKEVTTQLTKAKCELKNLKQQPDESFEEKFEKMQIALEESQKKYCGLKKTKECLEDKLTVMNEELDTLRRDSAKILTTTKCTAEKNRQILHEQINCLEFELAQCRATASLSLSEKEELINQLKQELNTLCGHFTGCQSQIKQLKEQVEYLTAQRYKDSNKKVDCYELFSNK